MRYSRVITDNEYEHQTNSLDIYSTVEQNPAISFHFLHISVKCGWIVDVNDLF